MQAMRCVFVALVLVAVAGSVHAETEEGTVTHHFALKNPDVQIVHCHNVGDPHAKSFNNRWFDFYAEGEYSLYDRSHNGYTSKVHILTTHMKIWGGAGTTSAVGFSDGANSVVLTFTYAAGTRNSINGIGMYKNNQFTRDVSSAFTLGNWRYEPHGNGGSGATVTNILTNAVVTFYYRIHSDSGYIDSYVNAVGSGSTGICAGTPEMIGLDASIFPHDLMANRPKFYTSQAAQLQHSKLLDAAKGNLDLVNQAKAACALDNIAENERHDCAFDWLVVPVDRRNLVIAEYVRVSVQDAVKGCQPEAEGANLGIKARFDYCHNLLKTDAAAGLKCFGDVEHRFRKLVDRARSVCGDRAGCNPQLSASETVVIQAFKQCGSNANCDIKALNITRREQRQAVRRACGMTDYVALHEAATAKYKASTAAAELSNSKAADSAADAKRHNDAAAAATASSKTNAAEADAALKAAEQHKQAARVATRKSQQYAENAQTHAERSRVFKQRAEGERDKFMAAETAKNDAAKRVAEHEAAANAALAKALHHKQEAERHTLLAQNAEAKRVQFQAKADAQLARFTTLSALVANLTSQLDTAKAALADNKAKAAAAKEAAEKAFALYKEYQTKAQEFAAKRDEENTLAKQASDKAVAATMLHQKLVKRTAQAKAAADTAERMRADAIASYEDFTKQSQANKHRADNAARKAAELRTQAENARGRARVLRVKAAELYRSANSDARRARYLIKRAGKRGSKANRFQASAAKHTSDAASKTAQAKQHFERAAKLSARAVELRTQAQKALNTYKTLLHKSYRRRFKAHHLRYLGRRAERAAKRHADRAQKLNNQAQTLLEKAAADTEKANRLNAASQDATAQRTETLNQHNVTVSAMTKDSLEAEATKKQADEWLIESHRLHYQAVAKRQEAEHQQENMIRNKDAAKALEDRALAADKTAAKWKAENARLVQAALESEASWKENHEKELSERATQHAQEALALKHTQAAAVLEAQVQSLIRDITLTTQRRDSNQAASITNAGAAAKQKQVNIDEAKAAASDLQVNNDQTAIYTEQTKQQRAQAKRENTEQQTFERNKQDSEKHFKLAQDHARLAKMYSDAAAKQANEARESLLKAQSSQTTAASKVALSKQQAEDAAQKAQLANQYSTLSAEHLTKAQEHTAQAKAHYSEYEKNVNIANDQF